MPTPLALCRLRSVYTGPATPGVLLPDAHDTYSFGDPRMLKVCAECRHSQRHSQRRVTHLCGAPGTQIVQLVAYLNDRHDAVGRVVVSLYLGSGQIFSLLGGLLVLTDEEAGKRRGALSWKDISDTRR